MRYFNYVNDKESKAILSLALLLIERYNCREFSFGSSANVEERDSTSSLLTSLFSRFNSSDVRFVS